MSIFKQCLFYDILLGHTSFDTIANSNNILADMGPGSPARAMKFLPAGGPPTIVTCQNAYTELQTGIAAYTELGLQQEGRKLFPGLTPALARAKLVSDLPVIANQFHGSSQTAQQIFQQRSLVNAFLEARANLGAADGDTFAMLRAEEQARNTYTSIAQQAMTWVPLLNIVLTVVFYAMFPVIFPLFLMPRTGTMALKGYFTGFFYLAAWGPLYVVLHMFIMDRASDSLNATAPGGITMAGMAGVDAVNADTATIAGFLMMSIPFLAAGMAKGAMAVSSQATSMLAPAQAAAEAAAVERTTGNYSYGNESFMNLSSFNRQSEQWNAAPSFTGGAPVVSTVNANGTTTKTMTDGASVFDTSPGMSRLAFGASLSQFANAERQQTLSELETARNTLSEERSRAVAFLDRASTRQTSGVRNSSGSESSSGIARARTCSGSTISRWMPETPSAKATVSRGRGEISKPTLIVSRQAAAAALGCPAALPALEVAMADLEARVVWVQMEGSRRASAVAASVLTWSIGVTSGAKHKVLIPRHRTTARMVQMPRKTVAAMRKVETSAGARAIPRTPTHVSAHSKRSGASISGSPKLMSW
ncbi:conjugal transfer protein TraG N-terminal domain-containing protein [Novosphingobium rhizosphaerae]|uniref:conjugal transfer protein TraG N-terminal domain-containing protein n=1 Tax=Novosphingobium rhizosphaerae TaxID=1551649 RepID=UPI003D818223